MKNKIIPIINFTLLFTLIFSVFNNYIYAETTQKCFRNKGPIHYSKELVEDSKINAYLRKVVSVGEFYYIEDETIKISLTKEQLLRDYNFTQEEYKKLSETVLNRKIAKYESNEDNLLTPNFHVSNRTLYISNSDLQAGTFAVLSTAASAGPAAMAAAPSLAELCRRVTYALATNRGIYIKPVASYPPLDIGYY